MSSIRFLFVLVLLFCIVNLNLISCTIDPPTLRNGFGELGEISDSNNKWSYYKFTEGNHGFTTILTALSGDPDLYISTIDYPTLTNNQYHSNMWGSDLIHINNNNNPNAPKVYFIGVYCFAAPCKFTILVSTENLMLSSNNEINNINNHPEPIVHEAKSEQKSLTGYPILKAGVSEKGTINSGAEKIYEFVIGKNHCDMKFELTALSGDPDLYLAYQPKIPSTTVYDYASNSFGSDSINIPKASSKVETVIYVGIFGYAKADYSILVSPSNCS